jgi:hypothetical protein
MKKPLKTTTYLALILIGSLASGLAQDTPNEPATDVTRESVRPIAPPLTAMPYYEVTSIAAKVGAEGGETNFSFTLENVGSVPLKFIGMRADCGCTLLNKMAPGTEIGPGQTVEIAGKIVSKPTDRAGLSTKRIYVTTLPGGIEVLSVQLTKEGKTEMLTASPTEVYWKNGEADTKEIVITNKTGEKVVPRVLGGRMSFASETAEEGDTIRLKVTPQGVIDMGDQEQQKQQKQTLGAVVIESASKKDKVFVRLFAGEAPAQAPTLPQGQSSATTSPAPSSTASLEAKKAMIGKLETALEKLRQEVEQEGRQ